MKLLTLVLCLANDCLYCLGTSLVQKAALIFKVALSETSDHSHSFTACRRVNSVPCSQKHGVSFSSVFCDLNHNLCTLCVWYAIIKIKIMYLKPCPTVVIWKEAMQYFQLNKVICLTWAQCCLLVYISYFGKCLEMICTTESSKFSALLLWQYIYIYVSHIYKQCLLVLTKMFKIPTAEKLKIILPW